MRLPEPCKTEVWKSTYRASAETHPQFWWGIISSHKNFSCAGSGAGFNDPCESLPTWDILWFYDTTPTQPPYSGCSQRGAHQHEKPLGTSLRKKQVTSSSQRKNRAESSTVLLPLLASPLTACKTSWEEIKSYLQNVNRNISARKFKGKDLQTELKWKGQSMCSFMEDEGWLSQRRAWGILNSQGSFLFSLYV